MQAWRARRRTGRSPHGERGLKPLLPEHKKKVTKGRSPHGERGLKLRRHWFMLPLASRSPHRERGLKRCVRGFVRRWWWSLPSRGAWIETPRTEEPKRLISRSPHGERGLKHPSNQFRPGVWRRSPHGERGLKLRLTLADDLEIWSLPSRGAWIETACRRAHCPNDTVKTN